MAVEDPPLAPPLAHLGFLLGTWVGGGEGIYPTIERFEYSEVVTIGHVGRPFLLYGQSTKNLASGLPAHAESGFFRPVPDGGVEFLVAHTFGVAEVSAGIVDGTTVRLASTAVVRTGTAKAIDVIERDLVVDGDVLRYEVRMAAVGQPLQRHLTAELRRQ